MELFIEHVLDMITDLVNQIIKDGVISAEWALGTIVKEGKGDF